jgi:hypothetical protein
MTTINNMSLFVNAFRNITGVDPTPQNVAEALKDPETKAAIDKLLATPPAPPLPTAEAFRQMRANAKPDEE